MLEHFEVKVDITGSGEESAFLIIPKETEGEFLVVLDGVEVATVLHVTDSDTWQQRDGFLPQENIDQFGEAISSHYM